MNLFFSKACALPTTPGYSLEGSSFTNVSSQLLSPVESSPSTCLTLDIAISPFCLESASPLVSHSSMESSHCKVIKAEASSHACVLETRHVPPFCSVRQSPGLSLSGHSCHQNYLVWSLTQNEFPTCNVDGLMAISNLHAPHLVNTYDCGSSHSNTSRSHTIRKHVEKVIFYTTWFGISVIIVLSSYHLSCM